MKRVLLSPTTPWGAPNSSALRCGRAAVSKHRFSTGLGVWQLTGALPVCNPEQEWGWDEDGGPHPGQKSWIIRYKHTPCRRAGKTQLSGQHTLPPKKTNQRQTSYNHGIERGEAGWGAGTAPRRRPAAGQGGLKGLESRESPTTRLEHPPTQSRPARHLQVFSSGGLRFPAFPTGLSSLHPGPL